MMDIYNENGPKGAAPLFSLYISIMEKHILGKAHLDLLEKQPLSQLIEGHLL